MHRAAYVALLACLLGLSDRSAVADEREDFFESKIRPVLMGTCFRCHSETKTSGGLRVDSRQSLLKGGDSGAAMVPGKPEESLLIRAIRRDNDVSEMPPETKDSLRPDQVADFVKWINSGAAWPAQSAKFVTAKHWAYEPIRDPAPPNVQDEAWLRNGIDAFIRKKQESIGVRPAPPADKQTLIRRATFDLTGLPPTPEEIDEFVRDNSPDAFDKVINRLLSSPAYGEQWARHWLDVVRYADTAGETADYPVPLAWRYRNYVIDAFRTDKPYDEFLREQIAGDILAGRRPREQYAECVTATGFVAISRRFGFDSENYHHLTIQDTIDTLGQTVLGLGLGCARCHDHKFDAISMNDYYALYGIFDSSRYPFPGSEQKQKVRSMVPLLPVTESRATWRDYQARIATLASQLAKVEQPVPAAVLRSLTEMDGDFELQAPAAGGSNGVLVAPWLYQGKIAVTNAAQSPFKNLYHGGKVGASVPGGNGAYRIAHAIYPRITREYDGILHVNLDVRVGAVEATAKGLHRLSLTAINDGAAVEVLIASDNVSLRVGEKIERLCGLQPNQWYNLQLSLDVKKRTVSGRVGRPGSVTEFGGRPFLPSWSGTIDCLTLDSHAQTESSYPSIDVDNVGVQELPVPAVSTEPSMIAAGSNFPDPVALTKQLLELTDNDGDLELQTVGAPPARPWNPGPKSAVKVSLSSQSPFRNIFPAGRLGLHMPNREAYDGFGLTLSNVKADENRRLFVNFEFRCANMAAGGDGAWRYYLGHGPGRSAAVELFFNGKEFFRRSGDEIKSVCGLVIGSWYQVQLALDLKAKTYRGVIASSAAKTTFDGQLATHWDGTIDYSFIDSYGHVNGARPSLDADNFAIRDVPLPSFDAAQVEVADNANDSRLATIANIRRQLAAIQKESGTWKQELNDLLANGPFEMTYGMAEGTPHNVHVQIRGEPDQLGDEVPRGFLKILGGGPLANGTVGSGRLELAHWLTRPDNPLTARVMVNRIWQYHFGRGLVKTPNDFGVRGLPPTHPELLDHLATQFIQSGWSVKAMHRQIMSSATYQQSSGSRHDFAGSVAFGNLDPTDLYISFPRRRLTAEEIRDAILAVSGELDSTPAREHPFPSPISWGYTQHAPYSAVYDHNKRSIYLMTQRLKRHPFLALFDGADPNATTDRRLVTTVPTQALFFLNDSFVHAKSEKWAAHLMATYADPMQRIEQSWRRAFGRFPTEIERYEAKTFLASYARELTAANMDNAKKGAMAAFLRTLIGSNEFLHVD